MQRNAFLPFWVCPSSMSSSIVLISVCSSQKCGKILFGLLFLRDSPQSTWFLPVSHFCTWSRRGCWRLGLPVSCGFFQFTRWCEGSLSLCGAVHCELLQQVLKSSLVPSWGGDGAGGYGAEGGLCAQQKSACVTRGAICTHLVAVWLTDLKIACAIGIKTKSRFSSFRFLFKHVHDDQFQSLPWHPWLSE